MTDPAMAAALEPVREIHAIRLVIQDETAGMTLAEKAAYHRRNAEELFASMGLALPQYVNRAGAGKLQQGTMREAVWG